MLFNWVIPWLIVLFGLAASTVQSPKKIKVIREIRASDNNNLCSTWGNHHFKTFDGDFYQLPFKCNYIFTSHCKADYKIFDIRLKRCDKTKIPTIKQVTMKLDGVEVKLTQHCIQVDDKNVTLPFSRYGISISRTVSYIQIDVKSGLVLIWNEKDALSVELDPKFKNETCGLCGDFNGVQHNEFINAETGKYLTLEDYEANWKANGPTETCEETIDDKPPKKACAKQKRLCKKLLLDPAFRSCKKRVDTKSFMEACEKDRCSGYKRDASCLCPTISEYSRQCARAGGTPKNWKTIKICGKQCPFNMVYKECGSPCTDSCSNARRSGVCTKHCIDGCFCPAGTVFDDITHRGCVCVEQCYCQHNGKRYKPMESYSTACRECTCYHGRWKCLDKKCPGVCSILGGSHISTYDDKMYTFHGDCSYVLSKDTGGSFAVLADLGKCGKSERSTCLSAVTLMLPKSMMILIEASGEVYFNNIISKLPVFTDDIIIFHQSTFYIVIHTVYGLDMEIQITPLMQAFIKTCVSHKGKLLGLCGDFNDVEADDFKTTNGLTEGTAVSFGNMWKTRTSCPDVKKVPGNPCSSNIKKEPYANYWCSMLSDQNGPFARCHSAVNPQDYEDFCIYDACACENSEECMCAAVSAYVHECAAEGILLDTWRNTTCNQYTAGCPSTFVYDYEMTSCSRTCRSLSQSDLTCQVKFTPVDGCGCAKGTYLNEKGECVSASHCPCYFGDKVVRPRQAIKVNEQTCTCKDGRLSCTGDQITESCTKPMVFFNCSNSKPDSTGSQCQKTCQTLDTQCVSEQCISGCACPEGLLSDGKGGCVTKEYCPCTHDEVIYNHGQTIQVDCNTCTCKTQKWECTKNTCHGTCLIYGEGHYTTFDDKKFSFNGDCGYIFVKDYCGDDQNGTFRVVTERIPCGSTESTCSTAIKLYLGNNEMVLSEENIKVIKQQQGIEIPYKVHTAGLYIVIEAMNGLVLIWNKKTTVMIKLSPAFKGKVCGLCGNYDGNIRNDFTTSTEEVVVNPVDFGNSWKVSDNCPDAKSTKNPCTLYSHRQAWALKYCSILNSDVFATCHSKVDPEKYYESCVKDTCACNTGGDCGCFCSTVAAYAAACNEAGACVKWRTPQICSVFCNYYNADGHCEWHYEPCGRPCMKTCRNPTGICYNHIPALEGCYPRCPPERPFLEEVTMKCVSKGECGCYNEEEKHYNEGESMPTQENCQMCKCTTEQMSCTYDAQSCTCLYEGHIYNYGDTVYETHDGNGTCFTAVCGDGGNIERITKACPTTTTMQMPTTSFVFSTTGKTSTTPRQFTTSVITESVTTIYTLSSSVGTTRSMSTSSLPPSTSGTTTTPSDCYVCQWSEWISNHYPVDGENGGEYEPIPYITHPELNACRKRPEIQCRSTHNKDIPLEDLGQRVTCSAKDGLICHNRDQSLGVCYNYEIRVKCCIYICGTNTTTKSTEAPHTTSKTTEKPTTTTGFTERSTTTTKPTETPGTTRPTTTGTTEKVSTTILTSPTSAGSTRSRTTSLLPPSTSTSTTENTITTTVIEKSATTTKSTEAPHITSKTTEKPTTTTGITERSTTTTKPTETPGTTRPTTTGTTEEVSTILTSLTSAGSTRSMTTSSLPPSTSGTTTTPSDCYVCKWSEWISNHYPVYGENGGEYEPIPYITHPELNACRKLPEIHSTKI